MSDWDAILLVAFGGPEGPEDVLPFLENVTRGRRVPRERLLEVAGHYDHFGGVSPLNDQVRLLMSALEVELARREIDLPVYWGNRNWHPMLGDVMRQIVEDGRRHVLAIVLAGYSSYSSCRQYLENIDEARNAVGAGAPEIGKTRAFFNHPGFVAASADGLSQALAALPDAQVAFTAHSIPSSMADGCAYAAQLTETGRLVAEACGLGPEQWDVVYQSRSGRPQDPWLEPDILDHMRSLHEAGVSSVVAHPIGFLSDHLEVLYDLDVEAAELADQLGMSFVRAATVGVHPQFVDMLGELVAERLSDGLPRRVAGVMDPCPDVCMTTCCPSGRPENRGP